VVIQVEESITLLVHISVGARDLMESRSTTPKNTNRWGKKLICEKNLLIETKEKHKGPVTAGLLLRNNKLRGQAPAHAS